MAPSELTSRLQFLNDSAHLLASAAPKTSRYLMSRCNALIFDNNLEPSPAEKRKACGACGSIIVLGWEATMSTENWKVKKVKKKTGANARKTDAGIKSLIYTCSTCGVKTRQPVDISARPARSTTIFTRAKKPIVSAPTGSAPGTNAPAGAKLSRKKRKNKNGGLGAILAQRKVVETKSGGLNLMDFMSKA